MHWEKNLSKCHFFNCNSHLDWCRLLTTFAHAKAFSGCYNNIDKFGQLNDRGFSQFTIALFMYRDTGHKENVTCLPGRNSISHYFVHMCVFKWTVLLAKYCSGDQIKNYKIGRACSGNGGRRGVYRVLVGKPGERDHLEDLNINGRIILRCIFWTWDGRHGLDRAGSG
jgi:hypothetical protein